MGKKKNLGSEKFRINSCPRPSHPTWQLRYLRKCNKQVLNYWWHRILIWRRIEEKCAVNNDWEPDSDHLQSTSKLWAAGNRRRHYKMLTVFVRIPKSTWIRQFHFSLLTQCTNLMLILSLTLSKRIQGHGKHQRHAHVHDLCRVSHLTTRQWIRSENIETFAVE